MDYSKWPEQTLPVVSLQLDPKNPRIPSGGKDLTQRELIHDLVNHDRVYELARRIVKRGFYPVESLIGMQQDNKVIILEGNRRLAALKLLIAPEQAPDTHVKKFRRLANRIGSDTIKKVRVLIAPDREAAAGLIIDKHTRKQVEKWSPVMQANFIASLVNDGMTPKELREEYGVPVAEAAALLRRSTMYQIACGLNLPEEARAVVQNPRAFPSSTLDRLLDNPKVAEFLGIAFDGDKRLRGKIPAQEFRKGYEKIVTDIALGKVDSRTVNTTESMQKYLNSFGDAKPDLRKKGKFTEKELFKGPAATGSAPPDGKPATTKGSPGPRLSATLVPHGVKCHLLSRRIREVFDELKRLNVERYPNAVAMLLRLLLELTLANHFDKTGKTKLLVAQMPPGKKGHDWSPPLSMMLKHVIEKDTILDGKPLKAVKKLYMGQHTALSLENMNNFVHNQYVTPTARELHGFWEALDPLLQITLCEPPSGT